MTVHQKINIQIDEITTHIYQGSLEASPWQSFLRCLLDRLPCDFAAIIWDSNEMFSMSLLQHRHSAERSRDITKLFTLANPLLGKLTYTAGPTTLADVIEKRELLKTKFYYEILHPSSTEHVIAMQLMNGDGTFQTLCLGRDSANQNFNDLVKKDLNYLRPHLEHALTTHALIKRHEIEKDVYSEALNRLVGTVILDGRGKVVRINPTAQKIVLSNPCFKILDSRFVVTQARNREEFNRHVTGAIRCRETLQAEPFVEAMRIEGAETDFGVLIRSTPASNWYRRDGIPSVIIHIDNFNPDETAPIQIVARLFQLTRSEARLASLLAKGLTLTEAALKLGLTESSVRTYSKKIFAKTGVNRQAELVRMMVKTIAKLARADAPETPRM